MRRLLFPVIAVVAAGLALAIPATGSAGSTGPAVKIVDNAFKPRNLTVKHGTTVHWQWAGVLMHNVVVLKAPGGAKHFKSRTQVHGTYSHLFTATGTFTLLCTIHGFTMTVKVT